MSKCSRARHFRILMLIKSIGPLPRCKVSALSRRTEILMFPRCIDVHSMYIYLYVGHEARMMQTPKCLGSSQYTTCFNLCGIVSVAKDSHRGCLRGALQLRAITLALFSTSSYIANYDGYVCTMSFLWSIVKSIVVYCARTPPPSIPPQILCQNWRQIRFSES